MGILIELYISPAPPRSSKSTVWKVIFTSRRKDKDNFRPIIVATHHLRPGMIWDGAMTKSFTVLLQILVIRWVPEYFVEVGAGFWAVATQITNNIIINDKDVQLLHGKGIKIRRLVHPSDWNGRGMCLVLVWEKIEVNRSGMKILSFFCKSRWPSTSTKNQGL